MDNSTIEKTVLQHYTRRGIMVYWVHVRHNSVWAGVPSSLGGRIVNEKLPYTKQEVEAKIRDGAIW